MNIAIAGAGIAGAYLYKLLSNKGNRIDVYDVKHETMCGTPPCAWGTSRDFIDLVRASGLDPAKYTLRPFDHVLIDEIRVRVALMTIDKPGLIKDLLGDAGVNYSPLNVERYDRVIDATGPSRRFLPPVKSDLFLSCVQWRVQTDEPLENRIKIGEIGYAWSFPISASRYHIGCGSLVVDPARMFKDLGWLRTSKSKPTAEVICGCAGRIRVTGPRGSQPFVVAGGRGEFWGVGESIGCVGPIAGDGIVPAMRSAQILIDHWDDPDGYTKMILKEFLWMDDERKLLDKLLHMDPLDIGDAWVLKKNSKRVGMQIGIKQAEMLMNRLKRTQASPL